MYSQNNGIYQKVIIDKNISKYEIKDEYNRFNDLFKIHSKCESLIINEDNKELLIENKYSSGYTGHNFVFRIDNKLNIIKATYSYWTDVLSTEESNYIIDNIDLKLNQNPFNGLKELRGQYTLQIREVDLDGKLINSKEFKGKFKTYKGVDKKSEEYKWAIEQNNIFNGITNENGAYLRPDIKPSLKSGYKKFKKEIKKLDGYIPNRLKFYVVINENGKIDKEQIRLMGYFTKELENEITTLLIEITEWYPACVDDKAVKSQLPIVIGIE